jgi:hypothetical protein
LRQPGPVGMTNATSLPMFNVRFIDMLGWSLHLVFFNRM